MEEGKKISIVDDKIQLVLPNDIAKGCSYFMEVMPGLMCLIVDFSLQRSIELTKTVNAEDFYIAYFDLSDEIDTHQIKGQGKIDYQSKLGIVVIDAKLKSGYAPSLKMYSFWLSISRPLHQKYLFGNINSTNSIVFSSHIDSRTRLCLLKLRMKNYDDPSFELSVRGTTLQVLGYLVERINEIGPILGKLSELDTAQVIKTQTYMMEQLLGAFPGIDFLAMKAGMSISKYKKLFKRIFKESPNGFFLREKLNLAQVLLKSGNFKSINEVANELGHVKPGYFAAIYKKQFGQLPGEVFKKSTS
jgi:AraC-like DNA-binding protein